MAQIKLDDIKDKITSKAEKEISSLEIKNPLRKKVILDSLQERLKAGDTLIMHYKLNDIKSLINKAKKDSVTYPAIRISIPKKDKLEYAYQVDKSDTIHLYIKHKSILKLSSVEVLLGKTPLYSKLKLKKKGAINVKIPAIEAGEITIKLTNRNYFPFKATLFVRNLKKEKKVIIKEVTDTLYHNDTVMVTKEELLYLPLSEQSFSLGAQLDLTKTPYFIFPIPFDLAKNGKGWVYWIGYNQKNIDEFKSVVSEKDPLIDFAMDKLHFLPYSEPKGLTCAFVNESNALKLSRNGQFSPAPLSLSLNNGPNYGKILEPTSKYQKKLLYLACLNNNGVSDQTVYFKSVYLEGKPYTEQVISKIPSLMKYFKIYTE
ncbi:MAG: hypothetical protein NWQ39_16115 [Saprospiraceae bacterium]|nr:hypothetical protein [Saprospiraceae bacterium]